MSEDEEQKRSFTVADKRRFSDSGDARPEAPEEKIEATPSAPPAGAPVDTPPENRASAREHGSMPAITFSTFVLSLSTQALAHLGEIPAPFGEQMPKDLQAAQQLIDILGILQDKTKGNLDSAESGLLTHALYDLRVKYVEHAKKPGS